MKFKVVWADAEVIDATDPADAWAQFCKLHEDALKHPNLHDRFVFAAEEPVATAVTAKTGVQPVSFTAKTPEPAKPSEHK